MATYYMSMNTGNPNLGPQNVAGVGNFVVEAGGVPTASVAVELNTTADPNLSRRDAVQMLQTIINYILADALLASPVLTLKP